jgi:peptide deformylase
MARCIQHEIDHLDGILYIDRMEKSAAITNEDNEILNVEEAIALAGKRL